MFGKSNQDDALNTVVGKGSVMEGQFEVADGIRVDGVLRGKITTTGSLIVGTEGQVDSDSIRVKDAVVAGQVKGPLDASHSVRLEATAEVDGDITTQVLVIEEGAVLRGICDAGPDPVGITTREELEQVAD